MYNAAPCRWINSVLTPQTADLSKPFLNKNFSWIDLSNNCIDIIQTSLMICVMWAFIFFRYEHYSLHIWGLENLIIVVYNFPHLKKMKLAIFISSRTKWKDKTLFKTSRVSSYWQKQYGVVKYIFPKLASPLGPI